MLKRYWKEVIGCERRSTGDICSWRVPRWRRCCSQPVPGGSRT